MTTKRYQYHNILLRPEHIEWAKKQSKRSGVSLSHFERILKDICMYDRGIDIEDLIKKYS